MPVPRTLYLIADGGRVRYVERAGSGHFRTFRNALSAHMHDKTSEFGHDKPPEKLDHLLFNQWQRSSEIQELQKEIMQDQSPATD